MTKITAYHALGATMEHSITQTPKQKDFPMHTHQECELYCFISGKGVFHIEGTSYTLKPGDILVMNNTESHYIEIDPALPYERFVVHFKKDFIKGVDTEGRLLSVFEQRMPGKNNQFRKEHFEGKLHSLLLQSILSSLETNKTQAEICFFALLCEVANAFCKTILEDDEAVETQVNQIIGYILENLDRPFSLDDICNAFFLCKSQLCRMFKRATGSTVWNYVTVKRLTLARELLEAGAIPTQVYLRCGFVDYSGFYRAYKKQFGTSPKRKGS